MSDTVRHNQSRTIRVTRLLYVALTLKKKTALIEGINLADQQTIYVVYHPMPKAPDITQVRNDMVKDRVIEFTNGLPSDERANTFTAKNYRIRDDLVDTYDLVNDILKQIKIPGLETKEYIAEFMKCVGDNPFAALSNPEIANNVFEPFDNYEAGNIAMDWASVGSFFDMANKLMTELHIPAYACYGVWLYQKLGKDEHILNKVLVNPYLLHDQICCMDFKDIDTIARNELGVDVHDRNRCCSIVLNVLKSSGSIYLRQSEIISEIISRHTQYQIDEEDVREAIRLLTSQFRIEAYANEFGEDTLSKQLKPNYDPSYILVDTNVDEEFIAYRALFFMHGDVEPLNVDIELIKENTGNIDLDEDQINAIHMAAANRILFLTGGAGVGKTHTVNAILKMYQANGLVVNLAASTGRAAKRMEQKTGETATTVHKLLKGKHDGTGFEQNASNMLHADALIIDECSMISVSLMKDLLLAVNKETRIVFVGDPNQLPPVEPGAPFHAMVRSGYFPVAKLTINHRQGEGNKILNMANAILSGKHIDADLYAGECELHAIADENEAVEDVIQTIEQLKQQGINENDIMVLSPVKEGAVGIKALNDRLQEYRNPDKKERVIARDRTWFMTGDRVIQLTNDPAHDVYNGDIGHVIGLEDNKVVVRFEDNGVTNKYDRRVLGLDDGDLTLAYATTVHKSQGSEYPAVIFVFGDKQHRNMNNAMLYTAVTRAQKKLVLIGTNDVLDATVRNTDEPRSKMDSRLLTAYRQLTEAHFIGDESPLVQPECMDTTIPYVMEDGFIGHRMNEAAAQYNRATQLLEFTQHLYDDLAHMYENVASKIKAGKIEWLLINKQAQIENLQLIMGEE